MKRTVWFLSFFILEVFGSLTEASELLFPAAQIEKGKGSIVVFVENSSEKLNFSLSSTERITVSGNSYFSNVTNDIESDGKSGFFGVKAIVNPHDGFYYWLKAGAGSYELELPSDTVKNKLSSGTRGIVFGMGARKRLVPETIVTPAASLDLGLTYSNYGLDSFVPGGGPAYRIDDTLEITEFQLGFILSKTFGKMEPYGGIQVSRKHAMLKDNAGLANVSGIKDSAGLILGFRCRAFEKEFFVFEAKLLQDTAVSAAWNVEF
ncbi:MAG: hypothetical protein JW803_09270 [Endomicrobiales bacterium]|nr:hypothetical protein [Endomicrobiales bacterium]